MAEPRPGAAPPPLLRRVRWRLEFAGVWTGIQLARFLPTGVHQTVINPIAWTAWHLMAQRREIALDNLRHALGAEMSDAQLTAVARRSFRLLANTLPEVVKLRDALMGPGARDHLYRHAPHLVAVFEKARALHESCHGCIFVTPHLGNWELLPYISAALDIPMAVVVRPLDNPHIERLLYQSRRDTGQMFLPKRNSMLPLQHLLRQGRSLGLLPDQSTIKGVPAPFFGRPALTTPVPALLAMRNERPIVVAACCWRDDGRFVGYVSDPIHPAPDAGEKAEVLRLTTAMNREMEALIRRHPEQYFWMHRRWKTYA
ncbi:MAG TPA: lysophospholipid acyltransferase family protein [Acidobacteriota bacterium]|nr:lysophospholipid acyltransferase family protein [Acidobacteriota bacterium]HQF87914.1 lysophospholipid acyltransferase family protein [Acidobacteriota bacterium]HQG92276.1 lysophospholipid acyltransferase family protein [Acidobacteriota bacterium]